MLLVHMFLCIFNSYPIGEEMAYTSRTGVGNQQFFDDPTQLQRSYSRSKLLLCENYRQVIVFATEVCLARNCDS